MTAHLVTYEAYDVSQTAVTAATFEVSFDGAATFRALSPSERETGFLAADGQKFVARVSAPHLWPVVQPLVIETDDHLDFDGGRDFGAAPLFSHSTGTPGQWRHILHTSLTLLRDGGPDRRAHGCPDVPPFTHNVLRFIGPGVLNPAGSGLGRLAAQMKSNVPSFGANGQLLFLKTLSNAILPGGEAVRVPELTAVFVPAGLDLTRPVSMHLFFTPFTSPKRGDYPYGTGDASFSEMTDNYLVSGGKRLLNQCNASGKNVVFVFPLAPRDAQFRGILGGPRTRQFLLEVAYFIQRQVGGIRFPFLPAKLGACSASCFSSGAQTWVRLLEATVDGKAFPELVEAYSLDGYPGETTDAWATMARTVSNWWRNDQSGRRVRLYAHYAEQSRDPALRPDFARKLTTDMTLPNGGSAFAAELPTATFACTPASFWETVASEMNDAQGYFSQDSRTGRVTLYPPYTGPDGQLRDLNASQRDAVIHQLMPSFFLQHALANSCHPDADV
jgi:hypothetical protein